MAAAQALSASTVAVPMEAKRIDELLRAAVTAQAAAGVVALAASRTGIVDEGAFGIRDVLTNALMKRETVFAIHSMTKAVTCVAAMQCVERGQLALDQPADEIVSHLATTQVLEGFDAEGRPRLRRPRERITLRRLLKHTAGFAYDLWNAAQQRYQHVTGCPSFLSGRLAALDAPISFEPGERWQYGINIEWVGRLVEAVSGKDLQTYLSEHIFAPLDMVDTGYSPGEHQLSRLAQTCMRTPDGGLKPNAEPPHPSRVLSRRGGLFSTGCDYINFLRMLLNGGSLADSRLLKPETVVLMADNHIGDFGVRVLRSQNYSLSNDVELLPGMATRWGLIGLINCADVPGGRSAGSTARAGLRNTYFWLDPRRGVAGVLLTQTLPFADPRVLQLLHDFEQAVYAIRVD